MYVDSLPVAGVDVILGNDLAGGKVFSSPVVMHNPVIEERADLGINFPSVFSSMCCDTSSKSKVSRSC